MAKIESHGAGDWTVVNFETDGIWVSEDTKILFKGYELIALAANDKPGPGVAINLNQKVADDPELTKNSAEVILCNFLSAISWHNRSTVNIKGFSGGSLPYRYTPTEKVPYVQGEKIHFFDEIPELYAEDQLLGLALLREARAINNSAFQFLSYAKIFNIKHSNGKDQIKWINENLDNLDPQAKERAEALKIENPDIGEYLYASGRCAVAHANIGQTLVNPDNYEDYRRLSLDMPLIACLAERYIEKVLGVKSSQTLWKEHLYELKGFKSFINEDLIQKILNNEEISDHEIPSMPKVSLRLRGKEKFDVLENLTCEIIATNENGFFLECSSEEKGFKIPLFLNFRDERLEFQIYSEDGLLLDDGTPEAMDRIANFHEFTKHYTLNGILEVWAVEYDLLLGRCDAYVPLNMIPTPGKADEQIALFRAEAENRRNTKPID